MQCLTVFLTILTMRGTHGGERRRAGLALIALVAVACSRVPPEGGAAGAAGFDIAAPGQTGPAATETAGSGRRGGLAPGNAGATPGTAGGGPIGSIGGPTAAVTGINGRTVDVVFHAKLEDCGDGATEAGASKATEGGLRVIDFYVKYFNDKILKDYGWKIRHRVIDDGGYFCPEKAQAAARQIVNELKPFAAIGLSVTERGPVLADTVTRAGIRHIGVSYSTFDELAARKGLAWIVFLPPEQSHGYLAAYIAKRIKGTQYRDPTTGVQSPRVYGMVVPDQPVYRTLASKMKARLASYGVTLKQTYFTSVDPGVAGQQALATTQRMRSDGINSLIFDFFPDGFFSGVTLTQAMGGQNYLPDILIGTYILPVLDMLHDKRVWARAQGVSSSPALALRAAIVARDGRLDFDPKYADISENAVPWKDAWYRETRSQDIEGATPSPPNIWDGLAVVALGLINNQGDRITAQSWAEGVWSTAVGKPRRCGAWRLLGREYEYASTYEFEGDPDGGREDFTTVYWVNKRTTLTDGYYESFDNYKFFKGFDDLPPRATRDTGKQGDDIPHQKKIGIHPWVSCKTLGLLD